MHILILLNRLSRLGDWKREYDLGTSNTSALLLLGQRLDSVVEKDVVTDERNLTTVFKPESSDVINQSLLYFDHFRWGGNLHPMELA